MEVPPLLLQTAGSLVAILALAGLAWWLRLGGEPRLASDDDVGRAAGEVEDGFTPAVVTRSEDGAAALVRDTEGRIMVIRRHGNRFAGRILTPASSASLIHDGGQVRLKVDCGEARFGPVLLDVTDPDTWVATINALNKRQHA